MPGLNLFIDTNIFLNLYEYSNDGVEELDKLVAEMNAGGIDLHVPKHLLNELERNRESKLKNAAAEFQRATFPEKVPRHMLGTQGAKDYADAVKKAKEARKVLVGTANAHALQKKLNIDIKYAELFDKATQHPEESDTFALAMERMHKGNPPGKSGSVGDQYNWETLLKALPDEDLHIVSADGDFVSPLGDQDRPLAFLEREWSERKDGAGLFVYKSIKQFLSHYAKVQQQAADAAQAAANAAAGAGGAADAQDNLPVEEGAAAQEPDEANEQDAGGGHEDPVVSDAAIELPTPTPAFGPTVGEEVAPSVLTVQEEAAKNEALNRLIQSGSFQTTHEAIKEIAPFQGSLTSQEAERLLRAANDNNQIRWIISDSDVYSFFMSLFTDHYSDISGDLVDESIDLLGLAPDPDELELSQI